jgi:hypothetical protein
MAALAPRFGTVELVDCDRHAATIAPGASKIHQIDA